MIDQKRRHAQPGRVTDTEMTLKLWLHSLEGVRGFVTGNMFSLQEAEITQHPTNKHFRGKGPGKIFVLGRNLFPISHAKLATAIDRRSPVQITDLGDLLDIRLRSAG